MNFLPYLIAGLKARERIGIPNMHSPFHLVYVYSTNTTVYDAQEDKIHFPEPIVLSPDMISKTSNVTLNFLSPTLIKNKSFPGHPPEFIDILKAISRRYALILNFHQSMDWRLPPDTFSHIDEINATFTDYEWHILNRHKESAMQLHGFTGTLHIFGEIPLSILFLLYVGEHIQVGSKTSFGLGQYSISIWKKNGKHLNYKNYERGHREKVNGYTHR